MTGGLVAAIDQGTSATKCVVLDRELQAIGSATRPVPRSFPRNGWVEQDPETLVKSVLEATTAAVRDAQRELDEVTAVAIANQTETFIVWERATGRPIHPAIGWQCRRTAQSVDALRNTGCEDEIRARTGLELDATFPASKLQWLLDSVPKARVRAERGELLYGDVASWIIWNLTCGETHITDTANVSRSMLADLTDLCWDPWLLELFKVPPAMLPEVRPCSGLLAETSLPGSGLSASIVAAVGDQQASLFGQGCWEPGLAKLTLGTGAFVWVNAGEKPPVAGRGLLASCAWSFETSRTYALEGFVSTAGAAVQWLVDIGILAAADDAERAMAGLPPDEEVVCVPAFSGLGTPHWDPHARGSLFGLRQGMTTSDLVRAVLSGVAHQVADVIDAMRSQVAGELDVVRADGGMAQNDWVLQRIADLSGVRIERSIAKESTAIGAGMLGCASLEGWPSLVQLAESWRLDRAFEPQLPDDHRLALRGRWAQAIEAARSWSSQRA